MSKGAVFSLSHSLRVSRNSSVSVSDPGSASMKPQGLLLEARSGKHGSTEVFANSGSTETLAKMTTKQKLVIISFCLSNFGIGVFYSLLGPFFPIEAAAKGLDSTTIGLVLGVYELVFVIISPVLGIFLTQIGPNFMFVSGIMSCGYCAILFGFLDLSPPGSTFSGLCFAVRAAEGIGGAGVMTASFAIMAHTFPDRVATMFGALELFTGLGLMVGPPIGGVLYQFGGYRLPFLASGTVLILLGVATAFLLPKSVELKMEKKGSILTLLTSPVVLLSSWLMICASGCIGFLDISLAPVLTEELGLTPSLTGLMFLVGPGVYGLTAPLWGAVADKIPNHSVWVLIGGYLLAGSSFVLLGPAPFLNIGGVKLWTVIVSQLAMGIGLGTMVVGFQLLTAVARYKGMPDTLATYGLVSGLFTSSFSTGAFLGPVAGGALLDNLEFAWSSTVIGLITAFSAILTAIYFLLERIYCPKSSPKEASWHVEEETAPLLQKKQTSSSKNLRA